MAETNSSHLKNGWLEDEISFWRGLFSREMLVSGSVSFKKLQTRTLLPAPV